MASSSTTTPKAKRYDVFLSFRGEDTRNGFTSHLYEALVRNQVSTFIDDNLNRGGDIPPSLFNAIEESKISIIIFSENYVDSKWCLKELAKILQCKHQIVIPVFYGVDPSDVRNQTGKIEAAFNNLEKRLQEGEMALDEVRSHLKEAGTLSGWDSHKISPESRLVKLIVGDILRKLNRTALNLPQNLVGMDSHIERVETLLCLDQEPPEFRIVGLWGMSGIGKTTIARTVYDRIYSRFDGFHFVENVSDQLKYLTVNDLREKIALKLFEEERLRMGNRTLQPGFIKKQFESKKVLVVLDDMDDVVKAKKLLVAESHSFCGGSRILVTSKDKQLLKNVVGDENHIYEVEGLHYEDALQLFSLHAFKQNHPIRELFELSEKVLRYTKGNPLALIVIGCALLDQSKTEWIRALHGLGEEPFADIQKVLRIGYDALCDEEKGIFLDIACFLAGKKLDLIVAYYNELVKRIEFKIRSFVDKSLITISKSNQLEMHDLLKEIGRFIEAKELQKRKRIFKFEDFNQALKRRKKRSTIEAVSVNFSQAEGILELKPNAFEKIDGLKFLEFCSRESKVRIDGELQCLPKDLRYMRWDLCPAKSLPSNFCAENLVELHMEDSKIELLWKGKQSIVNLKVINLRGARHLVELPDVSEGKNIQKLDLTSCKSLVKVPLSIQYLPELEDLRLVYCESCVSFPTMLDSKKLWRLELTHCPGIKMFPQFVSGNIVRELHLDGTNIIEVPSSIESLKLLEYLSMSSCDMLSLISTSIYKLKSLNYLDLSYCTNLESLPEFIVPMECQANIRNMETDFADDPGVEDLLSSMEISNQSESDRESSPECTEELCGVGIFNNLPGCERHHSFPEWLINLCSPQGLHLSCGVGLGINLSGCERLRSIPESIMNLCKLEGLDLSYCDGLSSLPENMERSQLKRLDVECCFNLTILPKLPNSLVNLNAQSCFSLKTISPDSLSGSRIIFLKLGDCFELLEERTEILDTVYSNWKLQGVEYPFEMLLPWSGIPEWTSIRNFGSSLRFKLPRLKTKCQNELYPLVFCVNLTPIQNPIVDDVRDNRIRCRVKVNNHVFLLSEIELRFKFSENSIDHLLLWCSSDFQNVNELSTYIGCEVSLEFVDEMEVLEVTECGVLIL